MEKKLGTLEMVLEERRRKKMVFFSKATQITKAETLHCFFSRERKIVSHARHQIKDRNSQIVDIGPVNLQTKFREDPMVNKSRRAL